MVKIKFCGIKRIEDVEICNELLPDFVGFIFFRESKRYIDFKTAKSLREKLDKRIKVVGVFVDAEIENIIECITNDVIDMVQLHGAEGNDYIKKLKANTSRPVIKAFKIQKKEDTYKVEESFADYILLDAGAGDGKTFEWDLIKDIKREYFLAGGLDDENVIDAIKTLQPYAVDVSSGIESNGVKDKNKMVAFINNVRKGESI